MGKVDSIWEEHNQPIGSMGSTMGSLKSTALGPSSTLFSGACHPFRGGGGDQYRRRFPLSKPRMPH